MEAGGVSEGMLYGWVCVRSDVWERWLGRPQALAVWGAVLKLRLFLIFKVTQIVTLAW